MRGGAKVAGALEIRLPCCPLCSSVARRWHEINGYRLERCTACAYVFVNPRPSREVIAAMYRERGGHCQGGSSFEDVLEAERRFPNSTVDARRIVAMIGDALGGRPGRLLDVGCGYGFFSAEALREGFEVDPLEIAPFERECATRLLGKSPLGVEFEDFPDNGETYDAILMSQVLEHAVDVEEWIAKAHGLLRRGGAICIAVPSFASFLRRLLQARDPYIDPPVHLNYFSPRNIAPFLERHGFGVLPVETVSRVRPDVLSRRIRGVPTPVRRALDASVRLGQRPVFGALDRAGLGIFANAYARRL